MVLVAAGAPARAETGTIIPRQEAEYGGIEGAGEFGALTFSGVTLAPMGAGVKSPNAVFQTFCLEMNERVQTGYEWQWTLNSAAVGGGGGAVGGSDPIDSRTAYLMTEFWNGTLAGYDYTPGPGRAESAHQLQFAIWFIEEEVASLDATAYARAFAWVDAADEAVSTGTWSGLGGVRALNIHDGGTTQMQDWCVVVDVPPTPPAPACGGGGHTIGFWSNKNGRKLIDANDLAALRALHLVDADGSAFDPGTDGQVASWIHGNARNMAYALSVQLAGMKLNVLNGFVNPEALVYAPGCGTGADSTISIAALMAAASAELGLHPYTPSGSPHRSYQECLKNALDAANNNANGVSRCDDSCECGDAGRDDGAGHGSKRKGHDKHK